MNEPIKGCPNITECGILKAVQKTRDKKMKQIEELKEILLKIEQIMGSNAKETYEVFVWDLPERLTEYLNTRGDKAKIVSENKRLTKQNQELALEVYNLKKAIKEN